MGEDNLSFLVAAKDGVFTVPGDGIIDFALALREFVDSDYEGWFVVEAEQDPSRVNPLECVLMAQSSIREATGI